MIFSITCRHGIYLRVGSNAIGSGLVSPPRHVPSIAWVKAIFGKETRGKNSKYLLICQLPINIANRKPFDTCEHKFSEFQAFDKARGWLVNQMIRGLSAMHHSTQQFLLSEVRGV